MKRLAQHILAVVNLEKGRISNLQLQKILYFTFIQLIKTHGVNSDIVKELYQEPFEAWTYGPVVPSIYHQYKDYGRFKINDPGEYDEELEILNEKIKELKEVDIYELVEESHKHPTWSNNQPDILQRTSEIIYQLSDLES